MIKSNFICLFIAKFDDISAVTLQGNLEMSETRA